jgi:hypothetical protein
MSDESGETTAPIEINHCDFNVDDFIYHDNNLAKKTPYGTTYKWHYRNILLPKQEGKLYWAIKTKCQDGFDATASIKAAFDVWQPYVPFTFVQTSDISKANIVIDFKNTTSDGYANWYNGNGMVLARAWAPYEGYQGLGWDYWGDINVNDYYIKWAAGSSAATINTPNRAPFKANFSLQSIITHELGHSLGLGHDQSTSSIMYPYGTPNMTPGESDIKNITRLYDLPYQIIYNKDYYYKITKESFSTILKRIPTPAESSYYVNKLLFNRVSGKPTYNYKNLLGDLASSEELFFQSSKLTKTYISNLYFRLFKRTATTTEIAYYNKKLVNGWTKRVVVDSLLKLKEWNEIFVKQTYISQLGIQPKATELTIHAADLISGSKEPLQIVWSVVQSEAYFKKSIPSTNANFIKRAHSTLLGRQPTISEYTSWVGWID